MYQQVATSPPRAALHPVPAVRADLLERLGRAAEARTALDEALRLVRAAPERDRRAVT